MRWLRLILLNWMAANAWSAESPDYLKQVKPILSAKCFACHGALKQEAGLRLDTIESMRRGGDSGTVLIGGKSGESLLIQAVLGLEGRTRMPLEAAPLSEAEVAKLRQWIDAGAAGPSDEKPEPDPREHWAFRKPVRPTVPNSPTMILEMQNPIDRFLALKQLDVGVTALLPADKATLLRRVFLDLNGLPPSADEMREFLNDDSPDAYDRVVKRLLDSPQHGERWGRHWMDVWRYSDWYGRRSVPDVMNSYPMIWRWRDWIVRSLNEDKGYDRMIVEMLAADELLPSDDANVVATGYLVRSWFKWNYETWMKDLVEHSGKAFLGMTVNCAQCHDHKYDPIRQEEYFRLRAFFEPLELRHERVAGEPDPGPFAKYIYGQAYGPMKSGAVRVFDEKLDAQTFMFSKGDSRLRIEGKPPVTPAALAVLGGDKLKMSSITLPIEAAYPGMKPFLQADERAIRQSSIAAAESALTTSRETSSSLPTNAIDELKAAEAALEMTRKEIIAARTSVQSPVLAGAQSLVLDAKQGRRALSHALPGIDSLAPNGMVSYLVQIVQDEHTNLQLALDVAQGATGGWVGFEKGIIKTYAPGGFNEIIAGKYNLAAGQNRFRVVMQMDLPQNRFLLTVTSLTDNTILADALPAGLNGWQPKSNGKRGLFLDARPGTSAIYDDLTFAQPDGSTLLKFDFESPNFLDGRDVVEVEGWANTGYSAAPATSKVGSAVSLDPKVQVAVARVAAAKQAVRLPLLPVIAGEAKLAAAKLELLSLEARITADAARYATGLLAEDRRSDPAVLALIHAANKAEREAAVATANGNLAASDHAIALAETKAAQAKLKADQPAIDAATKESQTAQQQRAAALNALNAANANLTKEPGEYTPLSPKFPQISTGRRAALAQWIADRENPLTARVAVNHMWLRHFGQALVASTHDFGRNGAKPTHPELLDWLACELMDSGWSMKHVHRLIVTSAAYRRTSTVRVAERDHETTELRTRQERATLDRDNHTYWRFPAARMQAEVVRDSLLAVAGELDTTIGGQELDHKLGLTSRRRSLYFAHHGEEKMEFLELFDAANPCDCYLRTSSVQPQQALALTNSELTRTLSQQLSQRLWSRRPANVAESAAVTEFVKQAFLQVLNREPRDAELAVSVSFLDQQAKALAQATAATKIDPAVRARENLIHALMNHNDFVTIR